MTLQSSFIDKSAKIGNDVKIGHFVSILENVSIGDNCKLEDGARICEGCSVDEGAVIGPNAVLRPHTKIGKHTIFGTSSVSDGDSEIGSYVTIQVLVLVEKGMSIGDNCFIGPKTTITNTKEITPGRHGMKPDVKFTLLKTVIENDVNVGATCRILPGIRIGRFSVIDMDTLVTKDIPAYSRVRGGKDKVGRIIGKTN